MSDLSQATTREELLRGSMLRPVRDRNVFESTVEQLASAVRLGVLADGERLPPERELSVMLGVSRVTLREAIAALRDAGLVATQPGRGGGSIVTYAGGSLVPLGASPLQQADLEDALDFRRVVEPGAAYLAASRSLTDQQTGWLHEAEQEVRDCTGDRSRHRLADSRLHLAIASLSGSPSVIEATTRAQGSLSTLLASIPVLPLNINHSHRQHQSIVRAIVAGRPTQARKAMEEHCDATSALLRGLSG